MHHTITDTLTQHHVELTEDRRPKIHNAGNEPLRAFVGRAKNIQQSNICFRSKESQFHVNNSSSSSDVNGRENRRAVELSTTNRYAAVPINHPCISMPIGSCSKKQQL